MNRRCTPSGKAQGSPAPPLHPQGPVRTASPLVVVERVNQCSLLTSALLLRVTPVPILTPGARAAPKSCPAGALTRDLREKSGQSANQRGREKGKTAQSSPLVPPLGPIPPRQYPHLCLAEGFSPPSASGLSPRPAPTLPPSPDGPSGLSTPDRSLCVLRQAPHCLPRPLIP